MLSYLIIFYVINNYLDQLRKLDEDKSMEHLYGPMIQGGHFTLKISHVTCVLHPLNTVTPLGDIKNLNLNGLIYLASISAKTKGLSQVVI